MSVDKPPRPSLVSGDITGSIRVQYLCCYLGRLTHHSGQKSFGDPSRHQSNRPTQALEHIAVMTQTDTILITAGPYKFLANFEDAAPETVAQFKKQLPYRQKLIHVRWSGEALWIPLGEQKFNVGFENHTSHPNAGQILLYPGGYSETEILFCYGGVHFASKMGVLAANHFLTIKEGKENLNALGNLVLWEGAKDVVFEVADEEAYVCIENPTNMHLVLTIPQQDQGIPQDIRRQCSRKQALIIDVAFESGIKIANP
jgi:hypothetical protein